MALPTDHTTICRWRAFVVSRWRLEHHPLHACLQAVCLGLNMRRADFFVIVREYVDEQTENRTYGKRK